MEKTMKGRKVLITGAAGGIGQALALAFARRGAVVFAHVRQMNGEGRKLLSKLNGHGKGHRLVPADLEDGDAVRAMFSEVPALDILVHNAGYCPKGDFLSIDPVDLEKVMRINFHAPFLGSQIAARKMKNGASILFITSIDGFHPGHGRSHYGPSKAAEINLMRNMALELAPKGIRVNAIAPGAIDTPMIARVKADAKRTRHVLAGIPQGRFGKPDEIAEAACFLSGSACPYATGSILTVDGGLTLMRGY